MMRRIFSGLVIVWLIGCRSDAQDIQKVIEEKPIELTSFSELLANADDLDSAELANLVTAYLDTLSKVPAIENGTEAYFLYTGLASSVAVAGDFNGWNPSGSSFLQFGNFDLWYKKISFESNARVDYKLVLNGSNLILDPKNPNKIAGGFGANSELAMPGYIQPQEIEKRADVDAGTVSQFSLASTHTAKTYTIHVYTPSGYNEDSQYPVAYFQDGAEYLSLASTANVFDNLIADGEIEPVIGVFVVPTDRNIEYAFEDRFKYTDFFVNELVPYIDANYATDASKERRAVIGDSYGGNISAIIAFTNPEVFGNCGIHSGAFQPNDFHTNGIVMDGVKKDIKVVSIWGTYEGSSLPPNMRKVRDYLIEKEYEVIWKELPEGHSWGLWRATQDDMLEFFFPKE
jgi:enterochelin esterase-like enzyme